MGDSELTVRAIRAGSLLQALRHSFTALRPIERIAWVAIILTPLALLLDYRLGLSLWSVPHTYPRLYYGPATDPGTVGMTALVWIGAGVATVARRGSRRGVVSVPTVSLAAFALLLLVTTVVFQDVDALTAYALLNSLLPLLGMAAVLLHPDIRPEMLRRLIAFVLATTAAIVVLTVAQNAIGSLRGLPTGTGRVLSDRFDVFLFGANGPPASGAVLAGLAMLVPAAGLRRRYEVALGLCLLVGVLLTQTRGAVVAVVAGAVVFSSASVGRRRAMPAIALAAAVVFLVASERGVTALNDQSNIIRRAQLVIHLDLFEARPVAGYGLSGTTIDQVAGAHNAVLSIALAGGALAVVLWLVAWCYPVVSGLAAGGQRVLAGAAAASVVAFFVGWGTTGNEIFVANPSTNALGLALAAAAGMSAARSAPRARPLPQRWLAGAFVACVIAIVVMPLAVARQLGVPETYGPARHVAQPTSGNAVANPGAESGIGEWATSVVGGGLAPLLSRSPDPALIESGDRAFLVYATNISSEPRDEVAYTAGAVRLLPRKSYRLSAYVSGAASPEQPLLLGFRLANGSLTQAMLEERGRGATKTADGNRVLLQANVVAPPGLEPVQVAIWKKALPPGATTAFAFDEVRLCAIDSPRC